jgi:predicted dehydrogenase
MLRVAVIGLGVGEEHARAYLANPQCELRVLCDIDADKLAEVVSRFPGVNLSRNPAEVLESKEIDLVSIASYDNCHAEQVIKALRARKHIFVEKPLCLTREELNQIRRSYDKTLGFSGNLVLRRSPLFLKLRELWSAGELGEVYAVEGEYNYGRLEKLTKGWRGEIPDYSVISGGGVHLVDLILWLSGEKSFNRVSSFSNSISTGGRYRDYVTSLVQFESGLIARVTANFGCIYPHFHLLSVYGTKGTFQNTPQGAFLYRPGKEALRLSEPYPGVSKGALIPEFVESIISRAPAPVTAQELFLATELCLSIDEEMGNESRGNRSRG